jgi:hypothetical protein
VAIACLASCAVIVLIRQAVEGYPFTPKALASGMWLATIFSFPGFVFLRLALRLGGVHAVLAFARAGALNGIIAPSLVLMKPAFAWLFVGLGGVAGVTYWAAERGLPLRARDAFEAKDGRHGA